jgi:hypothetical protein
MEFFAASTLQPASIEAMLRISHGSRAFIMWNIFIPSISRDNKTVSTGIRENF